MITVNAMGDSCPIPVIKTKKAMQALTGPETIEVLVDNEIAVQNVTKMASSSGGKVTSEKLGEKEYKVTIAMGGAAAAADEMCIRDRVFMDVTHYLNTYQMTAEELAGKIIRDVLETKMCIRDRSGTAEGFDVTQSEASDPESTTSKSIVCISRILWK